MKRITVSLPDELVDAASRAVEAGYARNISAFVAGALREHERRESLEKLLADWNSESPVPDEVARQIDAELDAAGMIDRSAPTGWRAG
jgi:Arc/MetJ-type ribon-helix-helix transcriptional regulator